MLLRRPHVERDAVLGEDLPLLRDHARDGVATEEVVTAEVAPLEIESPVEIEPSHSADEQAAVVAAEAEVEASQQHGENVEEIPAAAEMDKSA